MTKMNIEVFSDGSEPDLFELNNMLYRIDDMNQYKKLFDEFASVFSFLEVLNLSSKTGL